MSNSSANPSEQPNPNPEGHPEAPAAPPEVKDKFRQALERKRGQHADRDAAVGDGSSKISSEHAAAKTQRTFRRKSGG